MTAKEVHQLIIDLPRSNEVEDALDYAHNEIIEEAKNNSTIARFSMDRAIPYRSFSLEEERQVHNILRAEGYGVEHKCGSTYTIRLFP